MNASIRTVRVLRYITPFREGGSLPALSEADDGFLYVLKFSGAGQGSRALIADFLGGELARMAGLKVPELVMAELSPSFGQCEPDEEIQHLLKASTGINLGVHFLKGAMTFEPVANSPDPLLASKILWLDYLLTNVDRTPRNTNLLWWKNELWLIDHGAGFLFHHQSAGNAAEAAAKPFASIAQHVMLPYASMLEEAHVQMMPLLQESKIKNLIEQIPAVWIDQMQEDTDPDSIRACYLNFITRRLAVMPQFLPQIIALHGTGI